MAAFRRFSDETVRVLQLFLSDPDEAFYGLQILEDAELHSGSLYRILHNLESKGLLVSTWEDLEVAVMHGRRPRRIYRLNTTRRVEAEDEVRRWRTRKSSDAISIRPIPAPDGR